MGERNVYKVLVRKPKGKRPLGRSRHRWNRMDLTKIGWGWEGGVDSVTSG
jgi:hypothetical protein